MNDLQTEMRIDKLRGVYAHGWRRMVDGLYFCYWYGRLTDSAYYTNAGKWLIIQRRDKWPNGQSVTCFIQDNPPYAVEHLEGP